MSDLSLHESPAFTRDNLSATRFSSPQICYGIIEALFSFNILNKLCSLFLNASVDAKPLFIIYTTPISSVNNLIHLWAMLAFTAWTADRTASNSLAVEPVYYVSAENVLRASIVPMLCL